MTIGADAVNAYDQSPLPTVPTFVRVDSQCRNWYLKTCGIELDCKLHALPFQHALQGHPESGTLWANKIKGCLKELEFVSTTHETCLYRGIYKGPGSILFQAEKLTSCSLPSMNQPSGS